MRYLYLFVAVIVLVGCGASEAPAAVSVQAPPAAPTVQTTPVPLDKIDLVAILQSAGSLPKGLSAGETKAGIPDAYKEALGKNVINAASQSVLHAKEPAGTVIVAIYPDEIKLNEVYTARKGIMSYVAQQSGDPMEQITDVGKQAIGFTATTGMAGTFMTFTRCRGLVDIYMTGDLVDSKSVGVYAKALDAQLTEAICR